jgi:hypothetical protein
VASSRRTPGPMPRLAIVMEHSGYIGEHLQSGNIHGSFGEHPGRVEADAQGTPSQLQEALKESTKKVPKTMVNMTKRRIPGVDVRVHHVLPRVLHNHSPAPHHSNNQLGLCSELVRGEAVCVNGHSGNIRGTTWEHIQSGNILMSYRINRTHLQDSFVLLGTFLLQLVL